MLKNQQRAQDILAPHLSILQFFESHFSAIRLGNVQDQRLFCRLIDRTTIGLLRTKAHPLARELHFRIVLFAFRVLRHFTSLDPVTCWKVKDQILSAALGWFRYPPRYALTPYTSQRLSLIVYQMVFWWQ